MLGERRARVDAELAELHLALKSCKEFGDLPGIRSASRTIRQQPREQFELHCMYEALQQRFFAARVTQPKPLRCFDIDITRAGTWWRVRIAEIDGATKVRHRGDAEMAAREHIALSTGTPIAEVAVRIPDEPS